ncbi:urease subunit beta [Tomitella gaofuii]|uniref:urease subunit beta n=1 Tax=Tomitella gaofuii TaxID=2760083 RepID=UPI002E2A24A4|nr:urease subunit beta [Tomitella gaofuii]
MTPPGPMIPGEIRTRPEPIELNVGRERISLVVVNEGDRPIQIGSHLHFPDANPALQFDREQAQGYRLDVPAGTSVRLEPGVSRTVELVALGGRRFVAGLQIRDLRNEPATVRHRPRRIVPFGEPGSEVEQPARAKGLRMRVGEESATDADPAGLDAPAPDSDEE